MPAEGYRKDRKLAEFPALPLWTDAYLGDTTHLTTIEHGAYLLLLMTAWRSRETRLPDDDKLLARYARLGPQQWKRIKPVLAEFFHIEDGYWMQLRLNDEASAVRAKKEQASQAGVASALKRKGRHSTGVQRKSNEAPTEEQRDLNLTSNHIHKKKNPTDSKKTRLADDWEPEPFGDGTQCRTIVEGWSEDLLATQLERFKAHHEKEGSKFVDWQAAWRTWVLNSARFAKRDDDRGQRQAGGGNADFLQHYVSKEMAGAKR